MFLFPELLQNLLPELLISQINYKYYIEIQPFSHGNALSAQINF